jgi:glycosyltransferase involved in cell wall biosynthesis
MTFGTRGRRKGRKSVRHLPLRSDSLLMNILMIISKNDKYGAQRVFLDQVDALCRLGHRVVVVGRGNEGFVADSVRMMNVEYFGIPMKGIRDLLLLMRLVKKHAIDVIHTSLDRADHFGVLLSFLTQRPVVSTMNVPRYHIGYRFADRVVTVSRVLKDLLVRKGIRAERISVIRPGIDVERYANPVAERRDAWNRKLKADGYSIVFCHVSSIIPRKSHTVSLDLVAECKRRGDAPLLIIAGDPLRGAYYESLVKKISDEGLKENVYFTGWTSELPELLSLSNFTLLPSVDEAFGVVLLEGMAAGTPIVAREGEGGAELIEEFGIGFLYKPNEGIKSLADSIITLYRNEAQYKVLSDKCRETAKNEFSMTRFGRKLIGLYQSIVVK